MWDILEQIKSKNRRELTLTSSEIKNRENEITDGSCGLFTLGQLNLLRISKSTLTSLPASLGQLSNLTSLVCSSNKLECLPKEIGLLTKLMLLDASNNKLTHLPEELGSLEHLSTLNVDCNELTALPDLTGCSALALLKASQNHIQEFFLIKEGKLQHLAEVDLSNNEIPSIPLNIGFLPVLKVLNLESNKIKEFHGNVLHCSKLKILKLSGNELRDRRFRKLVDAPRTSPEQVLKFIRQNFPLVEVPKESAEKNGNEVANSDGDDGSSGDEDVVFSQPTLTIEYPSADLFVAVTAEALALRPHLVCCVVRNISLEDDRFKKFIVLQNKLHDGVCKKRLYSTIATHDLAKVQTSTPPGPDGAVAKTGLIYTAQPKDTLKFVPLNRRSKPISASKFLASLHDEADKQRKQQKSNNLSGLFKYLQLVDGWANFPCLLDASGTVLSVPPLTNGDASKISTASRDVLLEVTSDKSLQACKQTMEELLQAVIEVNPDTDITVQQVRVLGGDGGLRCVYPASDDLTQLSSVKVVRPTKKS